jgi:hypothetical protein
MPDRVRSRRPVSAGSGDSRSKSFHVAIGWSSSCFIRVVVAPVSASPAEGSTGW